ncbi:H-NS family nucleoid-associated regulatory protein [Trinickia mobilis]|uniref:H-NS family nucleoid-associated regulatory protein n=1 Tax=Trinickia mobilis TaxID=2816356 RepID=UPI001A8CDD01|nr:H-NS family nucleoid-associated regulatory protein [Trinickia mobilis]
MATLEQIQAKLKQLQAQADALISKKAKAAVDQIRALMLKHGLTTEDIEAKAKAKRAAKGMSAGVAAGKTKAASDGTGKVAPKYLHPKTGATWTGRGRAPAWIAGAKDRSRFLIAGGSGATVAVTAGTVNKAKTAVKKTSAAAGAAAHKGQRKGPQPAKYIDPKTGATWSGRGRAPAWLAAAKDRTRFLIDAADAADAGVASKTKQAAKKATPIAKRASAKTVKATTAPAVKKAVAKKAVSAKAAAPKSAAAKKAAGKRAVPTLKKAAAKKAPATKAVVANDVVARTDVVAAPEGLAAPATA